MSRLEDVTVGSSVKGLVGNEVVEIIAVKWFGNAVIEATFKDGRGDLGSQLLYREDEASLEVLEKSLPWSFNADGELLKLVSEAYRIHLAHIFDPYLAVHTSEVEPLPHQISAVYQEMLPRLPLRYVLADDPGAGKTIMTGLFIKELIIRGDLKRCLIVSPGSLAEQWQDELYRKFGLKFEILTNDRAESAITGNIFAEMDLCVARLDKLARSETLQQKLKVVDWDLIVVDEAHKMSASVWGSEIRYTKRFALGRLLSDIARHLLLLTATPHNGKDKDFQLFMSLIDPDRYEGAAHAGSHPIDVSDVMRRMVKEELLKFDGTPLFPERRAYTVNYDLSSGEADLYNEVTDYVRGEFDRADRLDGERKNTVGFALTILQRRLASSPEAIYQSLRRRRERLEGRLAEEKLGNRAGIYRDQYGLNDYDYDEDDFSSKEVEEMEEDVADRASAATTIHELEEEIAILRSLEAKAKEVRASGEDRKWSELSLLLQEDRSMFAPDGEREKLIVFTEHKDTLHYLTSRIRSLLGNEEAVVTIHGSMLRDERRKVEELFRNDKNVRILIATDAAGEGINLQRAHLMVNYDLPWNPNRLEQRFGRIHRIGQTEVSHLWNLVSKDTREGMVFQRLFKKLEEERAALGGKVFDILGKLTFDNRPLRDLLIEAVRYGNDPKVRNKLNEAVDNSLDQERLRELLEERALTEDSMDVSKVVAIREEMERIEAHKLQPHFIEAFFIEAFRRVGGRIRPREKGRYEIDSVPFAVRDRDSQIGFGEVVLGRYERACFDKDFCNVAGGLPAILLAPGHPLLEATIDLIREQNIDVLKRGAVLIDDEDLGTEARVLFYIEGSIQDGAILADGSRRIISKRVHFVELREDGKAVSAGYAPYLDYRPATLEEQAFVHDRMKGQAWLASGVEERAVAYAVSEIIPEHFCQVRECKLAMLDKTAKAVKERLTAEIQYWDFRAADLKQKEASGRSSMQLSSQNAEKRAEELAARMERRLAEIERERRISAMPPVIVGGALVVPKGLLRELSGAEETSPTLSSDDKRRIERAAMDAVMEIERELGNMPCDVSAQKCGYDIESIIPEERRQGTASLRFIEVKGRAKGADTVTVSKNEILTGLNKPEEFILAIVEVDGGSPVHTIYLKTPFKNAPDFTATSVNFDIGELARQAERVYEKSV